MLQEFRDAYLTNDLDLVKSLVQPELSVLNELFREVCQNGHLDMAKYLYANGANISDRNNFAFIAACAFGHADIAQWLYSISANNDALTNAVIDAFIHACYRGQFHIVKWLHGLGATITAKENFAFVLACSNGHWEIAKYLYNWGANISDQDNNAIQNACINGHFEIMKWLHRLGVNARDKKVFLLACSEGGHLHIAQWLHMIGTDISDPEAFIDACVYDRIDIVKWLIDIHYKSSDFIQFDDYYDFKSEIKDLLIDNNLVHPRQLEGDDLTYYLVRTENLVPADFDYPGTTKRGQHTKSALRNV